MQAATLTSQIRSGKNRILITAENGGAAPNPAGAFAALRIEYQDGSEEIIISDESWQVSEKVPAGTRPEKWPIDKLNWQPARILPNATWKQATDKRIGPTLARVSVGSKHMVRASLLKADALMRALGRPNRDQIVTSRPSELTTLEAVNLSTSATLIKALDKGAQQLAGDFKKVGPEGLIEEIYLSLLTRYPSSEEKDLLLIELGSEASAESVVDLLWALTMTPDFFIIR